MIKKALITAKVHPYIHHRLHELGYSVDIKPEIEQIDLLPIIQDYEILIITTYTKVDKLLIDNATKLKIVGRVGSGMENVDITYCQHKNIRCFNSPEGNGNAVGEHSLAMLLCLINNIIPANAELQQGLFLREENRGVELDGNTVGIIGYGHTGSAFAKKLRGFDVEVLVYDRYKKATDNFVKNVTLETLQQQSNIVSFHVPYTTDTHYYCNATFISKCLKKPIVINTSRGAILNTIDVILALKQDKISGLCIDVFEDEPLQKNKIHHYELYQKLISFRQVIATPHIAGWTVESKHKLAKILMDKIEHAIFL